MRTVGATVRRCLTLWALCAGGLAAIALLTGSAHARGARAASACPNAGRAARRLSLSAVRAALVCLVNQQRTERGLPPLSVSPKLNRSAEDWAVEMVRTGSFSHGDPFSRITATGYDWQAAGENIATGQRTPRAVVAAWMASPDHCQTILNPQFRNIGSGEIPHPVRGVARRAATWTQDFGLRMGIAAPSHNAAPARACPYR